MGGCSPRTSASRSDRAIRRRRAPDAAAPAGPFRRANVVAKRRITPAVLAIGLGLAALKAVSSPGGAGEGTDHRPVRVGRLKNPGFEAGTDDWSIHVYGAKPTIEADTQTAHEGKQSLRISSAEPSDAALGQELMLAPGGPIACAAGCGRAASTRTGRRSTAPSRSRRRAARRHRQRDQPRRRHGLDGGGHRLRGAAGRADAHRRVLRRLRQGHRHGLVRRFEDRRSGRSKAPLRVTRDFLPGDDQPDPVRPVHRVSLRSRTGHVGGETVRRQLRGAQSLQVRLPQGDRLPREALVSRAARPTGRSSRCDRDKPVSGTVRSGSP